MWFYLFETSIPQSKDFGGLNGRFLQSFIHPSFLEIYSKVCSDVTKLVGQLPRTSISFNGIAAIFQFQLANFLYYVNLAGLGIFF